MSGYTQESVRKLVAGSERANEMKGEIVLVLRLVKHYAETTLKLGFVLRKSEIFEAFVVELGEHKGYKYNLAFRLSSLSNKDVDYRLESNHPDAPTYTVLYNLSTSIMPLDFVKFIHDKLSLILEEAVERFPDISGKIQQLIELADY